MDRCQLPLDSSALSFTHASNTLIVTVSHKQKTDLNLIFFLIDNHHWLFNMFFNLKYKAGDDNLIEACDSFHITQFT